MREELLCRYARTKIYCYQYSERGKCVIHNNVFFGAWIWKRNRNGMQKYKKKPIARYSIFFIFKENPVNHKYVFFNDKETLFTSRLKLKYYHINI